jgi:uncharacterized protein (DUF2384 family)
MPDAIRTILDRLSDFYTPEEKRHWLHRSHPMLAGRSAVECINTGRAQEVLAVIESLDTGAFL